MARPIALIADVGERLRSFAAQCAGAHGVKVVNALDEAALATTMSGLAPDEILMIDTRCCSGERWVEAAREARRSNASVAVVAIPTNSSEATAIAALKAGVDDYFKSPFAVEELCASIARLRRSGGRADTSGCSEHLVAGYERMIGSSRALRQLKASIATIAATDSTVLVCGETGTGKDVVAGLLHENSGRCARSLISLNCAAVPDNLLESELFGHERGAFTDAKAVRIGAFERADGGTLFLDEIGDMTPQGQAKLLRVVENRSVQRLGGNIERSADCRVVVATNRDLEALVQAGQFRADLYYRLNVVRLELPPLRMRKEDLPELCEHFLSRLSCRIGKRVMGLSQEALNTLLGHHWPGNIRELRNVIESTIVTLDGERIERQNLPPYLLDNSIRTPAGPLTEEERLLAALHATNWNKSRAAEKLKWSRMTLYRKMDKYAITRPADTSLLRDLAPSANVTTV